ncbi:class I SAM-dependent methyltransferase [Xylanibacillus composti]|uniref:Methyltransferase n=1 Tax=Xylanibacillus composti TaxID=1572762 RepID=A0A8J4H2V5_9BACL|nr:class I SAM-dependent methyltransferase [Xylanibacillus composti]MDT9723413.1 class I SAM-dependent methyltransferase [Xylanibacillus composti]GIQ68551.1 methyltransferase [Xylanibacillus composti]
MGETHEPSYGPGHSPGEPEEAWYNRSFGKDYLLVYKHRDKAGAYEEVRAMVGWLSLPQGAKVLDLCCGMGRHAMALRDFGYDVTGMDLSKTLLAEAIRHDDGGQEGRRVNWIRGDMRQVPLTGPFDAVVNLFTSFGYFDHHEENARVLMEIARLLHAKGRWIIDFLNPAYVRETLVPHSVRADGITQIEEIRTIAAGYVRKSIILREPGSKERRYEEKVRLYELDDFKRMLKEAGLVLDAVYGGPDQTAYDRLRSPRMIMIGHKQAE